MATTTVNRAEGQRTRPNAEEALKYFEAKNSFTIGPVEVMRLLDQGGDVRIVDVRSPQDYAQGHLPGAVNIPSDQWAASPLLSKERTHIVYCYTQTCHLASKAAAE